MVNLQKSGDSAVKFVFTDSDHYLYGNGVVDVPVNSLLLVIDESDMVTFKKLSGDPFLSFRADNSNLGTKAAIEQFYKDNMVGSTGGGSESGITPSEVQDMINESISGKADTAVVNQAISEASQAILSVSGDVQTKVATSDFNAYSAATATAIGNKADTSAVTAVANDVTALSGAVDTKQDALQFYGEDTEQWEEEDGETPDSTAVFTQKHSDIYMEVSGDEGSSAAGVQTRIDARTDNGVLNTGETGSLVSIYANEMSNETTEYGSSIEVSDNGVGIKSSFIDYDDESSQRLASINMNHNDVSISLESTVNENGTVMVINPSGVTINDERVLTEADGTYFIDLDAIMSRGGLTDADWDGAIAAVNAHRPVYIKFYNDHYILESYSLDNNTMYLSASDGIAASRFTITKNGSNDYSLQRNIRGFVTDAEKTAWNAKVDTSAITTAITSGSTDSEIPTAKATYDAIQAGGGGATYSAGTNISIANDTINCTLPITAGTHSSGKGIIIGDSECSATGIYGLAIGHNADASGGYSVVIGSNASATGMLSFHMGNGGVCSGDYNFNVGESNVTFKGKQIVFGQSLRPQNDREVAFGYMSNSTTGSTTFGNANNTLFSVGNGYGYQSTNNYHNAFEIRQNGDIYIPNTDDTTDTSTIAYSTYPMVRLQDTITATTANTTALGGLKLVKLTQNEYDSLATKDPDTLYIISNVVS